MKRKFGMKLIAAIGMIALSMPALTATAYAATDPGETIDASQKGTLNITKYQMDNAPGTQAGTGLESQTPPPGRNSFSRS